MRRLLHTAGTSVMMHSENVPTAPVIILCVILTCVRIAVCFDNVSPKHYGMAKTRRNVARNIIMIV